MSRHADIPLIERVSSMLAAHLGDDFDAETFWDTLDGETDVMDVIGRLIRERVDADAHALAAKEAAATFKAREERMKRRKDAINAALGEVLDATGQRKVTHPLATVTRTAARQKATIVDEAAIPEQFWKVTKAVHLPSVLDALKVDEAVPGATLTNGAPGLTVRIK